VLPDISVSTVLPACFFAVLWPMVGLPAAAALPMYGSVLLISWTSASHAMWVAAAVFDGDAAGNVMVVCMVLCMCGGVFFIDLTAQPQAVAWVRFASYWSYSMGLMAQLLLKFGNDSDGSLAAALDGYSVNLTWSEGQNATALLAFGLFFRLAAYLTLRFSSKIRFS